MDEERILKKLDEIDSYLKEINGFIPKNLEDYMNSIEKKRVCERLLQISIECVLDVCSLMEKGLKLGAPSDEDDVFQKLKNKNVISNKIFSKLKIMKGFRNILVHRYADVDDELVFNFLKRDIKDFSSFKKEVLSFLRKN